MWNELRDELGFSLLCAYPVRPFEDDGRGFLVVRAEHTSVDPLVRPAERSAGEPHGPPGASVPGAGGSELESAAWLAAIVESSDDAIVGKTLEGIVTSWNRGAERLFGYRAEEMVGQPISRIIPPERREDYPMIFDSVRRGRRIDHYETERVRKDGRRIYVSLTVSPIHDASGRLVGVSKIARDVTERRRLDTQRERLIGMAQRAHAELEAASRAKDEFLATLGHELRNPIAALRNAIESAQFDAALRGRAMEIASRQARQLARLVDDLLDMARITQGRVRLNREVVGLNDLVRHAVEATRHQMEQRGHKLSVVPASESVRVECDALRLEQVLVNLLGNAAKFTPPGGSIQVECEGGSGEAVIRVRDDGAGIRPELLTRIFEPFVQARGTGSAGREGLGVGLAIARSFVALHGGTIDAHSEGPGRGAAFVVRLPEARAARETPEARGAEPVPARGVRILLVEDNPDVAEGMAMLLETFGHGATIATNGPDALDAARTQRPDVMLVDIGLPGMDGYEVARRVREVPSLRDVVLVALTGYALDEDRARAREAGFDHHLVKPVDPKVLRSLVGRMGAVAVGSRREALRKRA
jgi:PAS domain S-box-containing protein